MRQRFAFAPGQSLTVRRGDERRSYSICAVKGRAPRIGVREVAGGAVSGWLVHQVRPGNVVDVQAPSGAFTPDLDVPGQHVLIAAGSGITPVLSIAGSVLAARDGSTVTLLYGNRRSDSVMFADEIADLKDAYPDRICLVHVLSREPQEVELFNGRLDAAKLRALLPVTIDVAAVDHWWLCGPHRMVEDAIALLTELGVPRRRIHRELFYVEDAPPAQASARRAGRGPGRRGDRAARRPPQHHDRPGGHPGARRRPAGPPGPAVRLQGRGVRHLPRPARRGRGDDAPQLRPGAGRTRRGLHSHLPVPARLPQRYRRLRRLASQRASQEPGMPDLASPGGDLEPIERASADELQALQLERLRWSLRHAYANVPHYRAAFDAAGVHPDDCKDLADLARYPLTSKADLRENYPFGMFAVPREQVVRVHASSGTTGRATVVGYTRDDIDVWATVMARSIRAAGGRPGHILHNAYGYGLFTGGLGAHYGGERLGCTVVPVSGGMTERQVTLIRDFRPDIIMVTPSYMLAIVDEMERQGLDPAACSLRFGIFGAEPWTNEMRAEIEARAGLDATDIYGLSEVMGPGVAQECVETKDGLHIWEDHFYPEVIDPLTGEVLPEGEEGELVFTSLTKQAMPVIRYRTRDLTRLLPGTARTMRRMQKITGRTDDMIILRGVNLFPTQVEELIMGIPALSPHFQLHLTRTGRMDEMAVHVEHRPGAAEADAAAAGTALSARVKNTIGVTVTTCVLAPESIERSVGKMRRIVDHRG